VYRNKIISYGFNSIKTHPLQKQFGSTKQSIHLHAEIDAIKNALKKISINQLQKSDLYIARSKCISGKVVKAIAKPCIGCQRAITNFNINNVFYTQEELE
jgi:tRNA(Arg) A34 adenosine deaminase TadA